MPFLICPSLGRVQKTCPRNGVSWTCQRRLVTALFAFKRSETLSQFAFGFVDFAYFLIAVLSPRQFFLFQFNPLLLDDSAGFLDPLALIECRFDSVDLIQQKAFNAVDCRLKTASGLQFRQRAVPQLAIKANGGGVGCVYRFVHGF